MPSPQIIATPTPYTISSNAKPTINIAAANKTATITPQNNVVDITPKASGQKLQSQASNSLQITAQQINMQMQVNTPNIQRGKVTGLVKSVRFDRVGIYDYIGAALSPNALDANPVWRIRRVRNDIGQSAIVESAGGSNAFIEVWDDRLGLVYA